LQHSFILLQRAQNGLIFLYATNPKEAALSSDQNAPAENASDELSADERVDLGTFAYQLFEQVAEVHSESAADLYLARTVERLFDMSPGLGELMSDLLLAELSEELYRRGAPGREAARMVAEVQRTWSQEA